MGTRSGLALKRFLIIKKKKGGGGGGRNGRILMVSNTIVPKLWSWLWILNILIVALDSQYTNSGQGHVSFSGI